MRASNKLRPQAADTEFLSHSIKAFQCQLVGPLANKLGFEPSESENTETRELRTTIIATGLSANEPKQVPFSFPVVI
jgi:hypothetical protein